jgi:predicted CXXCH cytochrome family protein
MSEGKKMLYLFILVFCISLPCPKGGTAADQEFPDEARSCLECHTQRGLTVKFQNNESIEAFVNGEKFKVSVHASLGCAACHAEFSKDDHPQRVFRSKEQYGIKAALVCRQCHADEQFRKAPIHAALLTREGDVPTCTGCHDAHAVMAVAGGKKFVSEKQYCLGCHKHGIAMNMKNGQTVALKVDASSLEASVHAKLGCFDCHFAFSSTEHPKRNFPSARELSLTNAEACRRCHFDKYAKTIESIHYAALNRGNLSAPVCTDCHGAHSVAKARVDRALGAQRCGKCHGNIYSTYAASVHGKALVNERNADVPVCVDCHTAHSMVEARTLDYREKVPEICGQCHANKALTKKYGLYPGVVTSYLEDFHGVTLKLYRQQKGATSGARRRSIATCVDCHGVHDITKTTGPGTNIVKARLVKQCQRCHPGATEEFPDTWLSHYKPSLKNAPLVYGINLMYKLLIPFMLIGLILQILLHVWRYVVNR